MKRHKLSLKQPRNSGRGFPLNLVAVIIVFGLLILGFLLLGRAIKNLDCFTVRQVIIKGNDNIDLSYLKGHNIFDLDLETAAQNLKQYYPTYKSIRIIRILPDRLSVEFFKRQPLAMIKLYRYFCVDKDGVLFDLPQEFDQAQLPLIVGLETKIFGPKSGKAYNSRELNLALNIIQEITKGAQLKNYKLQRIDLANPAQTSFMLMPKLRATQPTETLSVFEVKIGSDFIQDKIDILQSVLIQNNEKNKQISYIDLRFKEPVIKYKDAK
ncbi:MAG: cell division protein FtsQ/DivIB [Candidatus Omnitrophica bacterium]|nr:cell division protein FtsQ/DivIB [Candidatus Omnitrophota bacterium]MDD5653056.1 cell division protein FtsQ/DivIB [Candidatus Omnitrophota bacterium]